MSVCDIKKHFRTNTEAQATQATCGACVSVCDIKKHFSTNTEAQATQATCGAAGKHSEQSQ